MHVWQRDVLHRFNSPLGLSCLGLTIALTSISLRRFGRLNAIIGFSGKIELSFVFCNDLLVMSCIFGRSGWYVTTKGIMDCV